MENKCQPDPDGEKLEGRYANYFKVGYNEFEFLICFGQYYQGNQDAELYTRIVTAPAYAKDLLRILNESIQRYEQEFGRIEAP